MPELPSYGGRLWAKAYNETARFIQHKLLTGVCVAISVIIVRLALWRFHRLTLTWAEVWITLLTIVGSYGIVVLGAFVVNLFRAPVLLDRERVGEIAIITATLKQQADDIAALTTENEGLKQTNTVPEVSAQEQRRRAFASAKIKELGEVGRTILRYVADQGSFNMSAGPLSNFNEMAVNNFLARALPSGLVSYQNHIMSIKPELTSAVEFVFSSEYDQDLKD
jgi:hypothetical protein